MFCLLSHFRFDGNFNANVSKTISCDRLSPTVNSRAFNPGRDLNSGVYGALTHAQTSKAKANFHLASGCHGNHLQRTILLLWRQIFKGFLLVLWARQMNRAVKCPTLIACMWNYFIFSPLICFHFLSLNWPVLFYPFCLLYLTNQEVCFSSQGQYQHILDIQIIITFVIWFMFFKMRKQMKLNISGLAPSAAFASFSNFV